jgi:pimeloyl-ACP methyl ester carboxylesterase/ketosteroid isomerase-like protein
MKQTTITLLTLLLTTAVFAGPVEDVANAERAFAKAFADRDSAKFFAMVAPDANFLGFRTLRGKNAVTKGWSRLFEGPAPFSWGPERVEVTADGKLGLSTGPIYDTAGIHTGDYSSIWQKQSDGSWKVIFDGPGSAPAEIGKVDEGFVSADDGAKLHYRKVGGGPVTLIVPLDNWVGDQFLQFANIATVITYDLRNRGRSQHAKDESTWTIQQDVRDLETIRRELKVEKFVPVGFSYLGLMVALYALDHPDRVTRVIQLGPVAFHKHPDSPPDNRDLGIPPEATKKLDELTAAGAREKSPKEFCEAQWSVWKYFLVGNPASASRFDLSFCAQENEWPVNFDATVQHTMASIDALELTPEKLQAIKVSVLTIHGDQDRNAPYAGGVEWAKTLPDARLVTVKGAAHLSWLDDPVTVFASIRHFLRGEWPIGSSPAK